MERFEYPMKSNILKILEDYHFDHPGKNEMAVSIRPNYFWDRMYQDIKQFVSLFQLIKEFLEVMQYSRQTKKF